MSETTTPLPTASAMDALAMQVVALTTQRDQFRLMYLDALAQIRKLELGLIGSGRERDLGDPNQTTLSLFALTLGGDAAAPAAPPDPPPKDTVRGHQRAKPTGRKPLPASLPRIDVTVLPPEVEARGTDAFERIGEDVTETVERRPASMVVVRVHKPKFVDKGRDLADDVEVYQAEPPELPIERGLAGPGLLADTIVRKYADHLPLHRLERIYARDGLELSRSTVCGWHFALAELVRPLIVAMWADALLAPYLCVDATGVLVQALKKCRRAHFFVVGAPARHVMFGFTPKHDKAAVDRLLANYKGVLVLDASSVYDHLFAKGDVVEAGCWAHARRYFFKALSTDPTRARDAIAAIGKLFHNEKLAKAMTPEQRLALRQEQSRPLVDAFELWCDRESLTVLDESPISKAIQYARNQRGALRRFLENGEIPIHNNWSERELRREAVGRKNWLFVGSDEGGAVNATFVSLVASCALHGVEPSAYLRDLFCLIPSWPAHRVLELAPMNWATTSVRPEVVKALDANIYRRASLGR